MPGHDPADWSVEKIKRVGGGDVKVLAWYRPDAERSVCDAQQDFARRIGEACARYDIPYVFELLVYPLRSKARQADYRAMPDMKSELVLGSVRTFADQDFGIDLFKVESSVAASVFCAEPSCELQALFDEVGRLCGRPWVVLSAGAGMGEFRSVLACAYQAGASGYLAGRAIWAEPFRAFPNSEAIRPGLQEQSVPYMRELNALTDHAASPWFAHPAYGRIGIDALAGAFRHYYGGFG